MNKEQVEGRFDQAVGKTKEVVGDVFDNESLEAKGAAEKMAGKVKAGYGDAKDDLEDAREEAIDDAEDRRDR